jgi:hypothetical protein
MPFLTPMIWAEPETPSDCYFCLCNVFGYNSNTSKEIQYPLFSSCIRPTFAFEDSNSQSLADVEISSPAAGSSNMDSSTLNDVEILDIESDEEYFGVGSTEPQLFTQEELNDLVRDCGLCKEKSELLASRLKEKNLLKEETKVTWYRKREQQFVPFFEEENRFVYCKDVTALLNALGVEHVPSQWRLFIDSSKTSLKAILLNNGNNYASTPIAHSVHHKESYESVQILLRLINFERYKWDVCGDFKIINFLLGQQSGNTKFPCFLCEWDSRDRKNHWVKKQWPERQALIVGHKNVLAKSLIDREQVILPALHIKLGIMKQFVKALDKNGECFKYLQNKFPKLSDAKIKEGIFVGPQIRKLFKDDTFIHSMTTNEKNAWTSFKKVTQNFLGNKKSENYGTIVDEMLKHLHILGCNMSLKLHYLYSHLDHFPDNLGRVSEEQGERMHQDMENVENRFQGRWNVHMMADYSWMIHRDQPHRKHSRKCKKRSFFNKRYANSD